MFEKISKEEWEYIDDGIHIWKPAWSASISTITNKYHANWNYTSIYLQNMEMQETHIFPIIFDIASIINFKDTTVPLEQMEVIHADIDQIDAAFDKIWEMKIYL